MGIGLRKEGAGTTRILQAPPASGVGALRYQEETVNPEGCKGRLLQTPPGRFNQLHTKLLAMATDEISQVNARLAPQGPLESQRLSSKSLIYIWRFT